MRTLDDPDDLEARLARLRAEWPVGSMVKSVMAQIGPAAPPRARRRGRLFAGLSAVGLAATLALAWLIVASQPATLLAAVQDGLERAQSAHLVITAWNDQDQAHRQEIWYRRDVGLRVEAPDQVIIEDGKSQWSWRTDARGGELVVLRQRSPGFFTTMLPEMLALSDGPNQWARVRTPELDRKVNDRACQGFTLTAPVGEPAFRALVLAEANGPIHEITVQQHAKNGTWRRARQIQIEYDLPVPAEQVSARLPEGARVVDRDAAFEARYPLERALHRVEMGGLVLAVHDVQPLVGREGFYVVSSVRGTPEFLKAYPPRRRPLNPELVALDVAFQPGSNGNQGASYERIVLGTASRNGVEFSWWLIVRRKLFQIKDGKRVYLPENEPTNGPGEPGRLDQVPGIVRVPLSATYWDEKHRDQNGVQQGVSTWADVPLPPDRPPTTLEDVASQARRDVILTGGAGGLLGVAADTKREAHPLRSLTGFAAETTTDAEFAAAVRRGLDDLRELDEVHEGGPDDLPPAPGTSPQK